MRLSPSWRVTSRLLTGLKQISTWIRSGPTLRRFCLTSPLLVHKLFFDLSPRFSLRCSPIAVLLICSAAVIHFSIFPFRLCMHFLLEVASVLEEHLHDVPEEHPRFDQTLLQLVTRY